MDEGLECSKLTLLISEVDLDESKPIIAERIMNINHRLHIPIYA